MAHESRHGVELNSGVGGNAGLIELELQNEVSSLRARIRKIAESEKRHVIRLAEVTVEQNRNLGQIREEHRIHAAEAEALSKAKVISARDDFIRWQQLRVSRIGTPGTSVEASFGLGPDAYYGGQHLKDIRVLEKIALNNGSLRAREAIARCVTDQRNGLKDILGVARGLATGLFQIDDLEAGRSWRVKALLSLARVYFDQNALDTDFADAYALYELAFALFGARNFDRRSRLLFVELCAVTMKHERMNQLIEIFGLTESDPVQVALLRCNQAHSVDKIGDDADVEKWLRCVNDIYISAGYAPVRSNGYATGTDLLSCLSAEAPMLKDGPLVSVIMPTHNGSEWIGTAIHSVLGQSWTNLELILVDDYSDNEHWTYLQEIAEVDSRVKLHRLDSNQGAYRARNYGFSLAQGEFFTVHDDDDWSHPQKIETQVKHLVEKEDAIGNMSFQTRIDGDWNFLRINDNPEFNQRNYSSMMMRREQISELGGWDDVNRAADAEFHDRVRKATGLSFVGVGTVPLSFMRARQGSLTAGEINRGALDSARQTFGIAYAAWHRAASEESAKDGAITALLRFDPNSRPYAVPANMKPGERNPDFGRMDIVYVSDLRFPGGNSTLLASEIAAAASAGLRVGVAHLAGPVLRADHSLNSKIHDVIRKHGIPIVTLNDAVQTALVVIRNPTVLQYGERIKSRIEATSVAIVANTAPVGLHGSNFCYDLVDCLASAKNMFGVEPVVFPESPQTRLVLEGMFPEAKLQDKNWPGFVDVDAFQATGRWSSNRMPVVGRHSRDDVLKWPDSADEIRAAYVQPDLFATRILGGAGSVAGKVALDLEPSVTVYPFGSRDSGEFLAEVDFWVYMHSSGLSESFGMSIVEALASGAVVILPQYMEALFGEAAIYARPDEVARIVGEIWHDRTAYETQQQRGMSVARDHFSYKSYVSALRSLLGASSGLQTY